MSQIQVKTTKRIRPMVYGYITPGVPKHEGWTKIGYTDRQTVEDRVKQQTHTVGVDYKVKWKGRAFFEDEDDEPFTDHDFHSYLAKLGVEREPGHEWFHVDWETSRKMFYDFKSNHGIITDGEGEVVEYKLRDEQEKAVSITADYYQEHPKSEFLWNAKPRFGKTLSVYDFVKRVGAQNVLIVTNRPAIANSWYEDYAKFLGQESNYLFVSETASLKDKKYCLSREDFQKAILESDKDYRLIEFLSLQDLKGSLYFGGQHDKLKEIKDIKWDVLVIDEAHEGVDTTKTDIAFDQIKRDFTLHLSGTPFKVLANEKFPDNAIYNWTYADEQKAKSEWVGEENNPYENLSKLNMFTYQMSEIVQDQLKKGIEIDGEQESFAFDLGEFFKTDGKGEFIYEAAVDQFLDALTIQEKFPFSTPELRSELKHTFWLLSRVDSAKALAKKLNDHPVFSEYKVVLAAGDGKLSEEEETIKSYDKVKEAVQEYDKTITLSVGQLTTGVTIPEWTAVLMLSGVRSPAIYMQAAFRAQNPWRYIENGKTYEKENAYIFDFDPARTLQIYEQFANDLNPGRKDDTDRKKENIRELLNFFPVIGEDSEGKMIELDAEKVLSIPRKIRSVEVVRRGFMCDFLFQNISNIFRAPQEVVEIINSFDAVKEPLPVGQDTAEELSLDENGEVEVSEEIIIGKSTELFGEKIFEIEESLKDVVEEMEPDEPSEEENALDQLKDAIKTQTVDKLLDTAKSEYGKDLKVSERKKLEKKIKENADKKIDNTFAKHDIEKKALENERNRRVSQAENKEEVDQIRAEFNDRMTEVSQSLKSDLADVIDDIVEDSGKTIVETVETSRKEAKKEEIEGSVRDHLRGFTRTIPSFLMAYGNEDTTLETFDQIVPPDVFKDVTSITLDQFRFLRDGGDYTDSETGEEMHFEGHLFDPVVFNDSVLEFLRKKDELSDYFDENEKEDIFDYIPPQRTNQIFTPKWVVRDMVDMLEEENPGCFDDPDNTFIDLYMKSGLYPVEIVKRLYNSEKIKESYPDDHKRLSHILEKQVFGLAPTEIIYQIALNFIFGFDPEETISRKNFKQVDTLPYAKDGTLEEKLTEIYED